VVEEDAADRDARMAALKRAREEEELARRSTAIKRELPRPTVVNQEAIHVLITVAAERGEEEDVADGLIQQELLRVLQHDAAKYPVKSEGKKKKKSSSGDIDKVLELPLISPKDLSLAAELVGEEVTRIGGGPPPLEEMEEAWAKSYGDMSYFPERQAWGRLSAASRQDRLSATKHQLESLVGVMEKEAKKLSKVEQKVTIRMQGYIERSKKLLAGIEEGTEEVDTWKLELACFKRLHGLEKKAVVKRLAVLEKQMLVAEERERVLQETYANLVDESEALFQKLQEAGGVAPMQME